MPLAIDVRLPRDQEAVFPAACCCCLTKYPEHQVLFSRRRFRWVEAFFFWLWLFRKPFRCEVPVCERCRPRVRRQKRLEMVALIVITGVAFVVIVPWFRSMGLGRQWQKLAMLAAIVVIGFPYFWWSLMRPPAFDLTVGDGWVEYEFANVDYAERFFDANPGAETDDAWRFVDQGEHADDDDES